MFLLLDLRNRHNNDGCLVCKLTFGVTKLCVIFLKNMGDLLREDMLLHVKVPGANSGISI